MNCNELTIRLKAKILRPNGQRRINILAGDCERRIGTVLFQQGLARYFYAAQQAKRMFIVDKWSNEAVAEILLDYAQGAETGKTFVYDLIVVGVNGEISPAPLTTKGVSNGRYQS